MTLRFTPPPQRQDSEPTGAERTQQYLQSINTFGDTLANIQQQKRSDEMQRLVLAMKAGEAGYDPNAFLGGQEPDQSQSQPPSMMPSTPSWGPWANPQSQPANKTVDSYASPPSPMMPNAPSMGPWSNPQPQPTNTTAPYAAPPQDTISAWNNHPEKNRFAPRRGLFQRPNVDLGGAIKGMGEGDYSGFSSLPPKSREEAMKLYEFGEKQKDRDQLTAYQKAMLDSNRNKMDMTVGDKEEQNLQKRLKQLGDDLDPSKQRSGAFGVSKQVYDRAERLESLASALPDGNLDRRQIEELAIGLNAMLSGSNVGAQSQVKALVPETALGNANKFVEWFANQPYGTGQQMFVQRMLGSIQREKQTAIAQMNRTRFARIAKYADIEKSNPERFYDILRSNDVNPDDFAKWKKDGYTTISAVTQPGEGKQMQIGRFKVVPH